LVRLALDLAAEHDLPISVFDILTLFHSCPLQETRYMRLPDGEWPDPYCQARPIIKLNRTFYAIKQAIGEYLKEVFQIIDNDLGMIVTRNCCK